MSVTDESYVDETRVWRTKFTGGKRMVVTIRKWETTLEVSFS